MEILVTFLPMYKVTSLCSHFTQPDNILLFHQLKCSEVDTILASLELQSHWTAALVAANLSAGFLVVMTNSGRGSARAMRRSGAPFTAL